MRFNRHYSTLILLVILVFIHNIAMAAQYYMFKDRHGLVLIQDYIPPEYAKLGYKVVNEQGIVIDTVPSEKLQRKNLHAQQKKRNQAILLAKENEEKKALDERLMQIFSSAEEIRSTGNKKILVTQKEIDTTLKHIQAFERNLKTLEAQLAEGKGVAAESIKNLRLSIVKNNDFILRKREEQSSIREEYLGYIKRYEVLNLRR